MENILKISTVLGRIAAVWFFWDKIKDKVKSILNKCKLQKIHYPDVLELPDNEFMFIDKISKFPTRNKFYPTTPEEMNLYNSLANYGLFIKQADASYKPTRKGKKFLQIIMQISNRDRTSHH